MDEHQAIGVPHWLERSDMPLFHCEAIDAAGKKIRQDLHVRNGIEAASRLRALGYFPTRIDHVDAPGRSGLQAGAPHRQRNSPRLRLPFGRVRRKDLCQFARQLSSLQDAGLPILRCLRILEQHHADPLRSILRQVAEDIEGGATLSEALAKHPKAFDRLFVHMVQAGETGGVLEIILRRLADFLERSQRLRRKAIGAMIYPAILMYFAIGMVAVMLWLIVPCFQEIYDDFGMALPEATRFLLHTSDWLIHGYGWATLLTLCLGLSLFQRTLKRFRPGRYVLDWIDNHLPVVGGIAGRSAVARLSRTLGTLLGAGVPILEALRITRQGMSNEVYARMLDHVREAVAEGESIGSALRRGRILDPVVISMIDVGEQAGQIDKMLLKIANNCDEEVDVLVKSLLALLEPFMVIWMGVVVGFIVLAMIMPLFCFC